MGVKLIIDIPTNQYNSIVFEDIDKLRECVKNGIVINVDALIARIEEMKSKDKLCEYPYVRCIEAIKEVFDIDSGKGD